MQGTRQWVLVRLWDRSDRGHIQNVVWEMCCGTLGQGCRGLKEDGKGIRLNEVFVVVTRRVSSMF